jgi:hypothetical protein
MKTLFIPLLFITFLTAFAFKASAQYNTGIGIRFGDPGRGLTLIQYFDPKGRGVADFIVSSQYGGFCFTGLYEVHSKNHNINIEVANVGGYLGIGAHVGSYKENKYYDTKSDFIPRDKRMIAAGIDGIAGVEWKLPHLPLLLSADIKPFYDLTGIGKKQLNYVDYALSLKYLF